MNISYTLSNRRHKFIQVNSPAMASDIDEQWRVNLILIMLRFGYRTQTDFDHLSGQDLKQLKTQAEFAIRTGVDPKYLNKILKEHRPMGKPTMERIAKALQIDIGEFSKPITPLEEQQKNPLPYLIEEIESLDPKDRQRVKEKVADYIRMTLNDTKKKEGPGSEGKKSGVPGSHHR